MESTLRCMLELSRSVRFSCFLLCILGGIAHCLVAQSPTTAAIAGRIVDADGRALSDVDIVVINRATGIPMHGTSRADGRYLVSGLEVGGPYSVTVRRIGSAMASRTGLFLSLGQQLHVDVVLEQQALLLQGVETRVAQNRLFSRAHTGTETFLSDSLIHAMPVIRCTHRISSCSHSPA